MPNYGLVVNSSYNPLSYEQYAAPFRDYAKVYNESADAYDALEMQANVWEKLAESEKDADVYATYKKYSDDLRAYANDLATNGLSTATRGSISQMRKRYSSEIKPIEDAWNTREAEIKMQQQARLQNPTIFFDRDATQTGLRAYMAGSKEFQSYTGDMLRQYSGQMAKNLAREIRDDIQTHGKSSDWYKILGNQYYERALKYGLSSDDIIDILSGGNSVPALNKIYNQVLGASGMDKWKNFKDISKQVGEYIGQGFWEAIGETHYSTLQNRAWDYYMAHRNDPQPEQPMKLWDWVGQDLDVDTDAARSSQSDLEFLYGIATNGVPEKQITTTGYDSRYYPELARLSNEMNEHVGKQTRLNPNWNADTDPTYYRLSKDFKNAWEKRGKPQQQSVTRDNPDYARYKTLVEKYGITSNNPTDTYYAHLAAHNELVSVNKYTYLNNATSNRLTRYVGNQITSGYTDDNLNQVIYQEDDKGKKITSGFDAAAARDILTDNGTIFQVNFNNGKVRLNNTGKGTYYIDPSTMRNLNVPFTVGEAGDEHLIPESIRPDVQRLLGTLTSGTMAADSYIKNVTALNKAMKSKGLSQTVINQVMNSLIEDFYAAMETNTRSLVPELPVTSTK